MKHQAVRGRSITAAVLLVASGILSAGAAALRWHGCLGANAGKDGCVQAQDHRYDYVLPAGPWVPVGGAAELSGVAFIVLAAALAVLGRNLPGALLRGCLTAPAALVFLVGATALASGLAGAPAAAGWVTPLGLASGVLWPVGMITAFTVLLLERSWAAAVVLLALAAGSPLAEYMVLMPLSGSHDTPPWSGAYQGATTIVAGLVLAAAAFHRRRRASHRVASVTV